LSVSWVPWGVRYDWGRGGDANGWLTPIPPTVTPESYARGLLQAQKEYKDILADLHIGGPAVDALRDIVRTCRDANVPLKIVLMPEGHDFRVMYPPHVLERINAFFADLGVEVVNAREWVPDNQFTDSHHLMRLGAEMFSERLAREHVAPLFKGGR
jgi:hypothetical protein